jgi:hypothetical protein
VWEDSYATRSRNDTINIDVLIPLSIGICHVLASLPENQRVQSFQALVLPSLRNLEYMTSVAKTSQSPHMASALSQIADEIRILATMLKTFTNATSSEGESMESGCDTSPDRHTPVQEPVLAIVQKGWPFIVNTAANYCSDEVSMHARWVNHCFLQFLNHYSARYVTEHLYCYIYFAVRSHASRL